MRLCQTDRSQNMKCLMCISFYLEEVLALSCITAYNVQESIFVSKFCKIL